MIIIIDNYDSFTYNIYQSVTRLSESKVLVFRNDEITINDIEKLKPDRLIISPGPGSTENGKDIGVSIDVIKYFAGKIPILGICLGHQAIGYAFGSKIICAKNIRHGVAEDITLDGNGVFRTIGKNGTFTRYHSLVIDKETLNEDFEISAYSKDGDIMGIRHKSMDIEGVQFHPESVMSSKGDLLFTAFINYRRSSLVLKDILFDITQRKDLTKETAEIFMEDLTNGILDERATSAILTAITAKGPSASEIWGCASVLFKKKKYIPIEGFDLTDIVGTGGDNKGSFNISSMAAIVASCLGIKVAKHGNRAVSSKSGSADFYEALGVNINISEDKSAKMITDINFGFLFAPIYHKAMRHAASVRHILGIKTIMNLVGPLSNPANAAYQMIGVYDKSLLKPVALASKMLGSKNVMVVFSEDGFDEASPCSITNVVEIRKDNILKEYTIDPIDFDMKNCKAGDLIGESAEYNAKVALDILNGGGSETIKKAVCLNAACAVYISKKSESIKDAYKTAIEAIDKGYALNKLKEIRNMSNG